MNQWVDWPVSVTNTKKKKIYVIDIMLLILKRKEFYTKMSVELKYSDCLIDVYLLEKFNSWVEE